MADPQARTQAYLDEHKIQEKLNELLLGVVVELPDDPFTWMADRLLEGESSAPPAATMPASAAQDPVVAQTAAAYASVMSVDGSAAGPPVPRRARAGASSAPAAAAVGGAPTDKEAKKAAKAAEKAAKEAEKAKKRAEREAAEKAKKEGPVVPSLTLATMGDHAFGNLFIDSCTTTSRVWTAVGELGEGAAGKEVWLRARVHNSRKQSAKLGFVVLRQRLATVQAVVQGKDVAAFACGLPNESVVDVCAEVTVPPSPIASCTQGGVELNVKRVFCVSAAATRLPLQVDDAGRSEAEQRALSLPRVEQDTRLNNRVIDIRTAANQGILRIQSEVCALFREHLLDKGFTEIHSPKMIATASEGGAGRLPVTYFDRYAYLAQSPQLYKQMALMGDLGRVFEIGPVFRSEKSFTHRHMTEFVGLDMEMTFKDDYHEVLSVLEGLFLSIFDGLNARCKPELEAVRKQYPFDDLKYGGPRSASPTPRRRRCCASTAPPIGAEQLAGGARGGEKAAGEASDEETRTTRPENQLEDMSGRTSTKDGARRRRRPRTTTSTSIDKDEKLLGVLHDARPGHKGTDFHTSSTSSPRACARAFTRWPTRRRPEVVQLVRHLHPRRGGRRRAPSPPRPADASVARAAAKPGDSRAVSHERRLLRRRAVGVNLSVEEDAARRG